MVAQHAGWKGLVFVGVATVALGCQSPQPEPTRTRETQAVKVTDVTGPGFDARPEPVPPVVLTPEFRLQQAREIYIHAVDLFNAREWDLALIEFQRVLDVDQSFYKAWYKKGLCYYQKKMYKVEIDCYRRCLDLYPSYMPALQGIAGALLALDELEECIRYYNKMLAIDPKHQIALYNSGLVYFDLEQYEQCIRNLQLFIDTYPDHKDRPKAEQNLKRAKERR